MTRSEWLELGYDKGIIDIEVHEEVLFCDAYKEWFKMRMQFNKAQSMDRIEVTYHKYYADSSVNGKCISKISDADIIAFILSCCSRYKMNYKELQRIMQIIKGVLTYMRDISKGGSQLHDWEKIKRNIPADKLQISHEKEYAIPVIDVEKLLSRVIDDKIYYKKQSACLCLCLNFYLGLRVGELASLAFDDFDFEKNVVKIYKTESKFYNRDENGEICGTMVYRVVDSTKTIYSVREIPLVPEALHIYLLIKEHHEKMKYDSPYLAYDGTQTILTRSLDRTLRKLITLCDIRPFSTHDIRKTFASTLHFYGVPTRIISDILGHSEIGTTENCYIKPYECNYQQTYDYMKQSINYKI